MLWDVMRCSSKSLPTSLVHTAKACSMISRRRWAAWRKTNLSSWISFWSYSSVFQFQQEKYTTRHMSPQYVPSLTSKKRSFTENSHDLSFKQQSFLLTRRKKIILVKKKCVTLSYLIPTNLIFSSSYSKNWKNISIIEFPVVIKLPNISTNSLKITWYLCIKFDPPRP